MIALCLEHAAQADSGAFTIDQLRALKRLPATADAVTGRFNWMRQEVLVRVGGNFYYQTPVIFELGATPCVWLSRDEHQNLMVNFRMPTTSGRQRASIIENFWSVPQDVHELVCPPMGRLIEVSYNNGDKFKAEFSEVADLSALRRKYPRWTGAGPADLPFPLTVAEIWETATGTTIEFGPNHSRIGGAVMSECFMSNCGAGIHIEATEAQLRALFPCHNRSEGGDH